MTTKPIAEMPWEVHLGAYGYAASVRGARGEEIAMNIYAPHAELIVRAVNAYGSLLEAVKKAAKSLNKIADLLNGSPNAGDILAAYMEAYDGDLRAVIAEAEQSRK